MLSSADFLGLLGLFGPLTLAEADTWATAVLVDELDAGRFESTSDDSRVARRGRLTAASSWATPADVKRAIRSSSIFTHGRAVFNIAGTKYRIVVWITYSYRVVYIRFIGTHRQYDAINAETV